MLKKIKFINLIPHFLAALVTLAIIIACGSGEMIDVDENIVLIDQAKTNLGSKVDDIAKTYSSAAPVVPSSSSDDVIGGTESSSSESTDPGDPSSDSGDQGNSSSSLASSSSGESKYRLECKVVTNNIVMAPAGSTNVGKDKRPDVKCIGKESPYEEIDLDRAEDVDWVGNSPTWPSVKAGTYNVEVVVATDDPDKKSKCQGLKATCTPALVICPSTGCGTGGTSSSSAGGTSSAVTSSSSAGGTSSSSAAASSSSRANSSSSAASSSSAGTSSSSAGTSSNSVTATCNVNNLTNIVLGSNGNVSVPRPNIVCSDGTAAAAASFKSNNQDEVTGWASSGGTHTFYSAGTKAITMSSVVCGTTNATISNNSCGSFTIAAAPTTSSSSAGGTQSSSSAAGGGGNATAISIGNAAVDLAAGSTYTVTFTGSGGQLVCVANDKTSAERDFAKFNGTLVKLPAHNDQVAMGSASAPATVEMFISAKCRRDW